MAGLSNRWKKQCIDGATNLIGPTIKLILLTAAYSFNPDHNFVSQMAGAEVVGTGYTGGFSGSGRKELTSKVAVQDDAGNRGYFNAANISYPSINVGVVAAIGIYREVSSDADSVIVGFIDTGGLPITTGGGDLNINWSTSPAGILQIA